MTFRWIIVLAIYSLLIGPIMDVASTGAKAKTRSQPVRTAADR
ncbi:MAG: hypothetical protein WCL32_00225 [Planctomycetota bacterium]|jgi:hypothetical protein